MTDADHAAVLRRRINLEIWRLENDLHETLNSPERAAIERAAALAECERLRNEVDGLLDELSRCQCERVGES